MRQLLPLLLLLSLGCSTAGAVRRYKQEQPLYEVMDAQAASKQKCSLYVRLFEKVGPETLGEIAEELRAAESGAYEQFLISYYLPGMDPAAGAWATSHFDPELEVRILGVPAPQELSEPDGVVGRWRYDHAVGYQIVIRRENGAFWRERIFDGVEPRRDELVEKPSPRGRRFQKKEGSPHGDHYVLLPDGNLEIRDEDGLVGVAKPADAEEPTANQPREQEDSRE